MIFLAGGRTNLASFVTTHMEPEALVRPLSFAGWISFRETLLLLLFTLLTS